MRAPNALPASAGPFRTPHSKPPRPRPVHSLPPKPLSIADDELGGRPQFFRLAREEAAARMPPKRKPAAKALPGALSDGDALLKAGAELLSLRRQLEVKTYEALDARRLERSWRERAELTEAALEQARRDVADIKADVVRQAAGAQEALAVRARALEAELAEARGQLAAARAEGAAVAARAAGAAQEGQDQAAEHQAELRALKLEFAAMLRSTLVVAQRRVLGHDGGGGGSGGGDGRCRE